MLFFNFIEKLGSDGDDGSGAAKFDYTAFPEIRAL